MPDAPWRIQIGSRRRWWQRYRWEDHPVGFPDPADLTDEATARSWFHALDPGRHHKRLVDPAGRVAEQQ